MLKWVIFIRKSRETIFRFSVKNDQGDSNDLFNDIFSTFAIEDCIYNKGKLISTKISAENSEIRENFA